MKTRKKIFYTVIVLAVILSTSVEGIFIIKETCYLGHWFTTEFYYSVGTHCIEFDDSYCRYACYLLEKCNNCGTIVNQIFLHSHNVCHRNDMHYYQNPWL